VPEPTIPAEIVRHYEHDIDESRRIAHGLNELELVRTREIFERHLRSGSLRILDVGGGTGVHARWLAQSGHTVEVVDPMPRHVAAAAAVADEGLPTRARAGDARALTEADDTWDDPSDLPSF
jgi:2-polyprenyl-3-methyl-5-hydroxy-6-metoxy-1,4-benzoquinol methylase